MKELTTTQKQYISKCVNQSIYASLDNDVIFEHQFGNVWIVKVNIHSHRFYLHNLPTKYFVLDSMTVGQIIDMQFELTRKFFKEIK